MEKIGDRIKQIRGEQIPAQSQTAMAKRTGVSLTTYIRYENGDRPPSVEFLQRLVKEFDGVAAGWLLTGEGRGLSASAKIRLEEIRETLPRAPEDPLGISNAIVRDAAENAANVISELELPSLKGILRFCVMHLMLQAGQILELRHETKTVKGE